MLTKFMTNFLSVYIYYFTIIILVKKIYFYYFSISDMRDERKRLLNSSIRKRKSSFTKMVFLLSTCLMQLEEFDGGFLEL
jgi:hypothetical protein